MGFLGPEQAACSSSSASNATSAATSKAPRYATSVDGVFAAGDARRGQSLIVWAINEGRRCAQPSTPISQRRPRQLEPSSSRRAALETIAPVTGLAAAQLPFVVPAACALTHLAGKFRRPNGEHGGNDDEEAKGECGSRAPGDPDGKPEPEDYDDHRSSPPHAEIVLPCARQTAARRSHVAQMTQASTTDRPAPADVGLEDPGHEPGRPPAFANLLEPEVVCDVADPVGEEQCEVGGSHEPEARPAIEGKSRESSSAVRTSRTPFRP